MLDSFAPYGTTIALLAGIVTAIAGIVAAFGVWLSTRHADMEDSRHRDELIVVNERLLERADQVAELQGELRTAAEETIRQVTGEGGYPIVIPNFTQIGPEIVEREGLMIPDTLPVRFGILNNSDAPVVAPSITIMKRVPIGEGFMGSDTQMIFRGQLGNVFSGMGQTMLNAQSSIEKTRDNWFSVVVFARAATFSQRIVVTWNRDRWETDYELRQLEDAGRNVEEKMIHSIRDDFPFQQLPAVD